jgi:hypothetical protein
LLEIDIKQEDEEVTIENTERDAVVEQTDREKKGRSEMK